jgi:hypothetical protein
MCSLLSVLIGTSNLSLNFCNACHSVRHVFLVFLSSSRYFAHRRSFWTVNVFSFVTTFRMTYSEHTQGKKLRGLLVI